MPNPEPTNTDPGVKPTAPGRRILLLIIAVFLFPVLLSTVLYVSGWRPEGKSLQRGELVQPARPVGDAELTDANGKPFRFTALRGKWVLVSFNTLPCNAICQNNLYKMRQVRLAQGRDATRVERLMISTNVAGKALRELVKEYPGLHAASGASATLQALARDFVSSQGTALDAPDRVYLVDPNGNLVMIYAPDADPTGMRKDLARLLRLSQIG